MSQENVEVVRQSIAVRADSRRRLEERLGLRFPGVLTLFTRLVMRLPARSRLRQALLHRGVQLGLESLNRRDFEAGFSPYDLQVELVTDSRIRGLGFDHVYRGRGERVRFQRRWIEELGELRLAPGEALEAVGLSE